MAPETDDVLEMSPLVMGPLEVSDPDVKVAVPSEKVALVMAADVLREPDFRVAVPSVNVDPKI